MEIHLDYRNHQNGLVFKERAQHLLEIDSLNIAFRISQLSVLSHYKFRMYTSKLANFLKTDFTVNPPDTRR